MENHTDTFGEFLAAKRAERGLSLRAVAEKMNLSATFIHDLERNNRHAPDLRKLEELAQILSLSPEEKDYMLDLAGQTRGEVAPDIPEYIMQDEYITLALRTARDSGFESRDWMKFVEDLRRRSGKTDEESFGD